MYVLRDIRMNVHGGLGFEEEGAVMTAGELEEAEAFAHWPAGSDGDKGSLIRESLRTVRAGNLPPARGRSNGIFPEKDSHAVAVDAFVPIWRERAGSSAYINGNGVALFFREYTIERPLAGGKFPARCPYLHRFPPANERTPPPLPIPRPSLPPLLPRSQAHSMFVGCSSKRIDRLCHLPAPLYSYRSRTPVSAGEFYLQMSPRSRPMAVRCAHIGTNAFNVEDCKAPEEGDAYSAHAADDSSAGSADTCTLTAIIELVDKAGHGERIFGRTTGTRIKEKGDSIELRAAAGGPGVIDIIPGRVFHTIDTRIPPSPGSSANKRENRTNRPTRLRDLIVLIQLQW
ncbi:hypothetical protein GGX14DRAFT_673380 [Mycena pura]|uniref:Uncharacterized protein n=1 Tax=Mycena pura TaxID=153505 RepID=A0AAD6UZR6_9AGAR|nr:hypothetical protein GGX14DRAFT_673380 [Mycena pura]